MHYPSRYSRAKVTDLHVTMAVGLGLLQCTQGSTWELSKKTPKSTSAETTKLACVQPLQILVEAGYLYFYASQVIPRHPPVVSILVWGLPFFPKAMPQFLSKIEVVFRFRWWGCWQFPPLTIPKWQPNRNTQAHIGGCSLTVSNGKTKQQHR